jgi:hypothetical protein
MNAGSVSHELDSLESSEVRGERATSELCGLGGGAGVGEEGGGVDGDTRCGAGEEEGRSRGGGKGMSGLSMGFGIGDLSHGQEGDRGCPVRRAPHRGHAQQFLIEKNAEAPGGKQHAPDDDLAWGGFWLGLRSEFDGCLDEGKLRFEEGGNRFDGLCGDA